MIHWRSRKMRIGVPANEDNHLERVRFAGAQPNPVVNGKSMPLALET